jgi:hypothetical protein
MFPQQLAAEIAVAPVATAQTERTAAIDAAATETTRFSLCSGWRLQASGFGVQGGGFRLQGLGFRVEGLGFVGQGLGIEAAAIQMQQDDK